MWRSATYRASLLQLHATHPCSNRCLTFVLGPGSLAGSGRLVQACQLQQQQQQHGGPCHRWRTAVAAKRSSKGATITTTVSIEDRPVETSAAAAAAAAAVPHQGGPVLDVGRPHLPSFQMLRHYQQTAVEAVLEGWADGKAPRQMVAMATGAGKTHTFSYLVSYLAAQGKRVLILVNRKELVQQTVNSLARFGLAEGHDVGILHDKRKDMSKPVTVATVQSASQPKTLSKMRELSLDLLIIDEAHHTTARSYLSVMVDTGFLSERLAKLAAAVSGGPAAMVGYSQLQSEFESDTSDIESSHPSPAAGQADKQTTVKGWDGNWAPLVKASAMSTAGSDTSRSSPPAPLPLSLVDDSSMKTASTLQQAELDNMIGMKYVLGVTATPYRNDDRQALKVVYHQQSYQITIGQLIREGYLCKVTAQRVMTYTDISRVSTTQKLHPGDEDGSEDFKASELSQVVNTPGRNKLVVSSYLKLAAGRKAVAFCCDIKHAEDLATMFEEYGVPTECISSKHKKSRDQALLMHKQGEIMVLTNVGILTEGYDDPSISCILMARPTKSTGLYTQCAGRGLRISPGKTDCMILDFTDRSHRLDKGTDLITCEYLFEAGPDVQLIGYEPPTPAERVAPEIKQLLQGGEMQLFGENTKYSWVGLENDLWLKVEDWKARPPPKDSKHYHWWYQRQRKERVETVWVHLMCVGHVLLNKKRGTEGLEYKLRVAQCEKMPALDAAAWTVIETYTTPINLPTPSSPAKSVSQPEAATSQDGDRVDDQGHQGSRDASPQVSTLLPDSLLASVEKQLVRNAAVWEHGLRTHVLEQTIRNRHPEREEASEKQIAYLKKMNSEWHLFADEDDVPDNLTKNQAGALIAFGKLYEAYQKANPQLTAVTKSGSPPRIS